MRLGFFLLTAALWTCSVTLDEKAGRRFGDPYIVNNEQQQPKEISEGGNEKNITSGERAESSNGNGYNATPGGNAEISHENSTNVKPGRSSESSYGKRSNEKSSESSDSSYDKSYNQNSGESSESTSYESPEHDWIVDFGYFSFNFTHICLTDEIFNAICRGGDECITRRGILHWNLKLHKCKWWNGKRVENEKKYIS